MPKLPAEQNLDELELTTILIEKNFRSPVAILLQCQDIKCHPKTQILSPANFFLSDFKEDWIDDSLLVHLLAASLLTL